MNGFLLYGLVYPVAAAASAVTLALAAGWRVPAGWARGVGAAGVAAAGVLAAHVLIRSGGFGVDHRVFRAVGAGVLAGVDVYAPAELAAHPFLNPPTAPPLFVAFTPLSPSGNFAAWCAVNAALAVGLVPLARRALAAQGDGAAAGLTGAETSAVAAALGLSVASALTIELGQLALAAAALILLAFDAAGRSRPWLGGAALGLATVKAGTLVPFLLLFHRRSDRGVWLGLAATVAVLVCLGGHPERFPGQCRELLRFIAALAEPGRTNDVSYRGPYNEWILGIDHAFYRVGVRDRPALAALQAGVLGGLGAWLAREVWGGRVERGLGLALVSLYAVVFLYHRVYDAVTFAPALVYAVARGKASSGRARACAACAAAALLGVLYVRGGLLARLTEWAPARGGLVGGAVEALVLPCGTWLTLLAMGLLWAGGRAGRAP